MTRELQQRYVRRSQRMNSVILLVTAGVVLLTACALSLWNGKTVGLYGAIETSTSLFYWVIVVTYGGLGGLCLLFGLRMLIRVGF